MKSVICVFLAATLSLSAEYIHDHGFWVGADIEHQHQFDESLSKSLVRFFTQENATSVVDFGCGLANYTRILLDNGIYCEGYDGNPNTPEISGGLGMVLDLSQPVDLEKRYDWVLSLEVGEHLPKEFESTFIANVNRHAIKGVIISWALKAQGGYGHFNCQDNDYIKERFAEYGYINDLEAEEELRKGSYLSSFVRTLMVFRKP